MLAFSPGIQAIFVRERHAGNHIPCKKARFSSVQITCFLPSVEELVLLIFDQGEWTLGEAQWGCAGNLCVVRKQATWHGKWSPFARGSEFFKHCWVPMGQHSWWICAFWCLWGNGVLGGIFYFNDFSGKDYRTES
jgi:hypothetical protein